MGEEQLEGVGGLKIFIRSWRPETRRARGVVVLVHGFNSHSGYYQWAAEQLVARDLAVYALDLRGRGRSDGERFYVQKFADYVSDVDSLVMRAKSSEPGLPVFLLGHSAGGVIACIYALEHQSQLAGLISESFAHEVPAPEARVVVLTTFDTDSEISGAIKGGAKGYLLKDAPREVLLETIRKVHAGETFVPAELVAKLVAGVSSEGLTNRELEVLKLVARGLANKEVATHLDISETTVKTHLRGVFAKLRVLSRTEAIAAASRRGLIQL